jgi:hypothetical protein
MRAISICRTLALAGVGAVAVAGAARADFRDALLMPYAEAERAFALPDQSQRNDPFLTNIVDPGGLKVDYVIARFEPNSGPNRTYAIYARGTVRIDNTSFDARVPIAFGDLAIDSTDQYHQIATYCDRTMGYGRPLRTIDTKTLAEALTGGPYLIRPAIIPHYDAQKPCTPLPIPVTFDETHMQANILGGSAQVVTTPQSQGACDAVGKALVASAVTYHELAQRGAASAVSKRDVALRLSEAAVGLPPCPIP